MRLGFASQLLRSLAGMTDVFWIAGQARNDNVPAANVSCGSSYDKINNYETT
jgi:hypothetical protein